jgi:hypothetical protein
MSCKLVCAYILYSHLPTFSLCLGVIIALPVATPQQYKNTAKYAFGDWTNTSGYPDGFAFILGMLAGEITTIENSKLPAFSDHSE